MVYKLSNLSRQNHALEELLLNTSSYPTPLNISHVDFSFCFKGFISIKLEQRYLRLSLQINKALITFYYFITLESAPSPKGVKQYDIDTFTNHHHTIITMKTNKRRH